MLHDFWLWCLERDSLLVMDLIANQITRKEEEDKELRSGQQTRQTAKIFTVVFVVQTKSTSAERKQQ